MADIIKAGTNNKELREWNAKMRKCRKCYYGEGDHASVGCNYSAVTGKCRSLICGAGDDCTVYISVKAGEKKYGSRRAMQEKISRLYIRNDLTERETLPDLGDWRMEAWGR